MYFFIYTRCNSKSSKSFHDYFLLIFILSKISQSIIINTQRANLIFNHFIYVTYIFDNVNTVEYYCFR